MRIFYKFFLVICIFCCFSTRANAGEDISWTLGGIAQYYETHTIFGGVDPVAAVVNGGEVLLGLSKEGLKEIMGNVSVEDGDKRTRLAQEISNIASSCSATVGEGGLPTVGKCLSMARPLFLFLWLLQLGWLNLKGSWSRVSFLRHLLVAVFCVFFLSNAGYGLLTGGILGFSESLAANFAEAEDTARAIAALAETSVRVENEGYSQRQNASGQRNAQGVGEEKVSWRGVGTNAILRIIWWISATLTKIVGFVILGSRQLILAIVLMLGPFLFCFAAFEPLRSWGTAWLSVLFSVALWKPFYVLGTALLSNLYLGGLSNLLSGQELSTFGMLGWNILVILVCLSIPILTHSIIKGFGGFAVGGALLTAGMVFRMGSNITGSVWQGSQNAGHAIADHTTGGVPGGGARRDVHM